MAPRTRAASFAYNVNYLPDDILGHIISFLPIKEAVSTSVLSRRWRYLFTLSTNLEFEVEYNLEEDKVGRILNFVNRLVLLHDIGSVLRFQFRSHRFLDPRRVYEWICALVGGNNIQELDICIPSKNDVPLLLPQSLFTCENLVVLKLNLRWNTFDFKVPDRICLPNLKVLHLEAIPFPNDGSEERLFLSCPALEDVVLYECFLSQRCLKFSVSNQNLKRLQMDFITSGGRRRRRIPISININTPSLVLLKYCISRCHSLVFIDGKSLVEVVIAHRDIIVGPALLSLIQNIRTLKISSLLLMALERFGIPIPLLDKLTCLEICDWEIMDKSTWLENFLARCVVLEALVFEEYTKLPRKQITSIQQRRWKSTLACLLLHLKTIEIQSSDIARARMLMTITKFFLKNARVLEVLKILHRGGHPDQEAKVMEMLSNFPRASRNVNVEFIAID